MPYGGQLAIGGSCISAGPDAPRELAPGRYVCLTVSDTGVGMDEATLRRAAEPFFTTKGAGKGTGLGLSMVHGVAAQSGGTMRITSRQGDGTTVELWLPVSAAMQETIAGPRTATSGSLSRQCRVLVVDDDPLVVASTSAMLEDLGHMVVEALSGARALDLLKLGTNVDVVVTDHAMPGMTGAELAWQIRQVWPDLPIILASGYAELPDVEDPRLPRLSKPYLQDELATQIAKAIHGAHSNVISLDAARRA
jgi:CheY-like chemotaxis protein